MNRLSKYRTELYGFSILWIMIFHGNAICDVVYFHRFPVLKVVDRLIGWGNMGVEVFILLAGIGAYYSFTANSDILSFYKKRAKRIYLPIMLICWPYWIWQLATGAINVKKFLMDISLMKFWITGDQQIWFVSAIVVFYLLYPLIHKLFSWRGFGVEENSDGAAAGIRKFSRLIELLVIIFMFIFCVYKFLPNYYKLVEIGLNRLPIFVLGVWLGPIVRNNSDQKLESIPFLFLITLFGFYLLWIKETKGIYKRQLYELMGTPLTIILALIADKAGKIIKAIFRFFGQMSLECYLAHIIIIRLNKAGFFFPYSAGGAKKYLILMCISIAVAYAAFLIQKLLKHSNPAAGSAVKA